MIRLILADDHAIFRQGLARLLESDEGIELAGEAGDGEAAWDLIREERPDVAVLDISMPGKNGIDVAREIRAAGLPTRALLLTMHDDPTLAQEAEEAGVLGFVVKEEAFSDLLTAIRAVADGQRFVSRVVAEKVNQMASREEAPAALSPREREVLGNIASGLTNKEIARKLEISPKTVDTHRTRLMRKLNVHTTADMVRYAMKIGLTE